VGERELQIPPLRSPGFPVETGGVGELHAAFLTESRTRGCWLVSRSRKSGYAPVGMTKGRAAPTSAAVTEGWTERPQAIRDFHSLEWAAGP
jgi:hypothetical protein